MTTKKNEQNKDMKVVKEQTGNKGVWYKTWWGVLIVIFLILPYFLIWEVWAKTKWSKGAKIAVTATIAVLYILFWTSTGSDGNSKTKTASKVATSQTSTTTAEQKTAEPAKTETPKAEETETKEMKILREQKAIGENITKTATNLITENKMSELKTLYKDRWDELAKLRADILYDKDLSDAEKKNIGNALKLDQEGVTSVLSKYEQLYP